MSLRSLMLTVSRRSTNVVGTVSNAIDFGVAASNRVDGRSSGLAAKHTPHQPANEAWFILVCKLVFLPLPRSTCLATEQAIHTKSILTYSVSLEVCFCH